MYASPLDFSQIKPVAVVFPFLLPRLMFCSSLKFKIFTIFYSYFDDILATVTFFLICFQKKGYRIEVIANINECVTQSTD